MLQLEAVKLEAIRAGASKLMLLMMMLRQDSMQAMQQPKACLDMCVVGAGLGTAFEDCHWQFDMVAAMPMTLSEQQVWKLVSR